ncbi:16S rRNA (guanine(527)-N(7))-methyltransferase RsmG [Rhizobium sp. KVB221]|uniref:Ribosomal RNA small subunit methyltransferase G n=1 Tax=Rhizobium setariae TaxID=2801340 RepID=A0A936YSQ0_9HYPH|nr:16S rRNA (guanine(527)-N(7))-methyltransferase RsmG [Rhizobium setariae]MBL0374147.1 16S rRNA (guanine(527)-N(7))-methyltransferase RsmG [Rhizobium setariae]
MIESLRTGTTAIGVSRETQQRLEHFAQLFQKWAKAINLAAPSTLGDVWDRHIRDSLQIYALSPGPQNWIDLGSGGGFPGVITAICLAELNAGWVNLVESNNKKAAFLRTALAETGGRGSVHPIRIESAPALLTDCDRVSARALADLDTLLGFIHPWSMQNSEMKAFLHKGRDYRKEIEVSRRRWNLDLVIHRSSIEEDSVILEVSGLSLKT